ncbi:MAG: hypothetical protein PHQ40_03025 [Anaerolineaceae bacterium]|nr:hypothetical protein [Anaerolineaceae bacterium]
MVSVLATDIDDNTPNIQVTIRTLLSGGFVIEGARREPGYMLIHAFRYDEFGTRQRYCFALAEVEMGDVQIEGVRIAANQQNAQPVIIGVVSTEFPQIQWLRFINLFGGPVFSSMPLNPSFVTQLEMLGFNKLPDGLVGTPDDLFEVYIQVALEFIYGGRVIRYGQERLFEARPDGLAIPNPRLTALYDAKSYSDGYDVTLDTTRQFGSYIKDFQRRYSPFRQHLNAFIVISGAFQQKPSTLENRSRDLISEFGVPIAFLTAHDLGAIIEMLKEHPSIRQAINWARIVADPVVNPSRVQSEIDAILKDGIIPARRE